MWYEKSFRRHLCDMHIDDWNEEFLSKFSPDTYLENLKKANIQNAMLYFQSHVGLCYYPTKSGKMHNAWIGKEDQMQSLARMCRNNSIAVTGYYSLIYNNWAHQKHPEWRMVDAAGNSRFGARTEEYSAFAGNALFRYGLCCPNNPEYRAFVSKQINEIVDYFEFDGMFFDMLFWNHLCYCDCCKTRFQEETGYDLPVKEDWNDPVWLLHIKKRREWMGQYAQSVTNELKALAPHASVEHNFACAVLADGKLGIAEEVNNACDYTGGDLYGGPYRQSFTCKFYRNITKNQPFEYMFSRCDPNLEKHTVTKSMDAMRSSVFLTSAHHGATLAIDAIDPAGTMDRRVYERLGMVFEEERQYEAYYTGEMVEDVGVYYSLRSKFNAHHEPYTNHTCSVNAVESMIRENICCGVTGGYHDISKYQVLIASCLTGEDSYDDRRIVEYVRNGGCLYFSGGDCRGLLKEFFGAEITGRTRENILYIAPNKRTEKSFGWFNADYPLHFDGTAPVAERIDGQYVGATLTLPYTPQDVVTFASIHSNPPGIKTDIPAIVMRDFGKGKVLWSALPIEGVENLHVYRSVFLALLADVFSFVPTVFSDAPKDVEIVAFRDGNEMVVSSVLLNEEPRARKVEPFRVCVRSGVEPRQVLQLPQETARPFTYKDGIVCYEKDDLNVFDMIKIIF